LWLSGGRGTAGQCGGDKPWEAGKTEAAVGALHNGGKKKTERGKLGFYRRWGRGGAQARAEGAAPGMSDVSRGEGSSDATLARCSRGVGETD
jgi:hypothetical protein